MTVGIFFGLIGLPMLILLTALICFVVTARYDKDDLVSSVNTSDQSKNGHMYDVDKGN
jgi:hypothetical protein